MSCPTHLILVRHAAAECTHNGRALLCGSHDVPLSERGRVQVELLRRRLADYKEIAAVYSSPLQRALETARAAPQPLANTVRILRSLAEIDCGEVDGTPLEEVRRSRPDYWSRNEAQDDDSFCWPGGETYVYFRKRVLRAVRIIGSKHAGQNVLMVTHAGVINQILGSLCNQRAAKWENFRPGNATVTELLWRADGGEVIRFDDRAHLS